MASRSSARLLSKQTPLLEFLAPSWSPRTLSHIHRAYLSTSSSRHSSPQNPTSAPKPTGKLSPAQKAYLSSALRINQAGELAATLIYTAQTPPLTRAHPHLRPLMKHMYDQEAGHLETFNALLAKHRIRPTALIPVWRAAASFLGWSTALLGREAAMACTEAVETEIGGHYNDQVRELIAWKMDMEARGESMPAELEELLGSIRRIRDEELEHLDHAVENDAREATAWPVLTAVIRGGCRGAIWVCEKV